MNSYNRYRNAFNGVGYGNAGMAVSSGIQNNSGYVFKSLFLYLIDQFTFNVALKKPEFYLVFKNFIK